MPGVDHDQRRAIPYYKSVPSPTSVQGSVAETLPPDIKLKKKRRSVLN